MKKAYNPNEWEAGLLSYIRRNKNRHNMFICSVQSVSSSGMSRHIAIGMMYKKSFLNISHVVAHVTGMSRTKEGRALVVGGCGMDMIFHTLETFLSAAGVKSAWKFNAVQHYSRF